MTKPNTEADGVFEFCEAMADYADNNHLDYAIIRDEGDWCGIIKLSDSRGPFSAYVDFMERGYKPKPGKKTRTKFEENVPDFNHRVAKAISSAIRQAREKHGTVPLMKIAA